MLIVEYRTDGPLLGVALDEAPEMVIRSEEQYAGDGTINYFIWAEGGDFDAFEAGLSRDPTVTDPRTITQLEARRLYRMTSAGKGYETATLPEWSDLGITVLDVEGTSDGWTFRLRVPDREALAELRSLHRERDRPFRLQTIYHESESETEALLTDPQKEALVAAYEAGHFDVPQRASQADVAAQLGIAPQSLSERLKRGVRTLIGATLVPT